MSPDGFLLAENGEAIAAARLPELAPEIFLSAVADSVGSGGRLAAFFARPVPGGDVRLTAVVAPPQGGRLALAAARVREGYPALTPRCPAAHLFEREIFEDTGLRPEGHPWLKPVRGGGLRPPADPGRTEFFRMVGAEIHEVAVGPVHAGVIEPGHFRFQCHGETVYHLEIALGYQHRGAEKALRGGPSPRTIHFIETLCGDSSVAHAAAYSQALEALCGFRPPARAEVIRAVALELERIANHVGDLGALAGDIGFLPTSSYCGRIRGDVLNLTAAVCGNRFGRGLLRPGGTGFDLDGSLARRLLEGLAAVERDTASAVELLWGNSSVLARFEGCGALPPGLAREIGLVGPPARACGLELDTRQDFPWGLYRLACIPVSTSEGGDVLARAYVRWLELGRSFTFLREQLASLPPGAVFLPPPAPGPGLLAVSLVEGWRGEICHVAQTDGAGRILHYKVVDPSFHNWFGLACAMRNEQISDFPLCNKSFNLSYCGHDL